MTTAGTSSTRSVSSSSPTRASEFFEGLGRSGNLPILRTMSASMRFDLVTDHGVERWHVAVDHGDVVVTQDSQESDCVVVADAELFDRILRGDANFMASLARGAIRVEGDVRPLVRFQRLFPGPTPGGK